MKRALKWIGGILAALVLTAVLGISRVAYTFKTALEPIESVEKYHEVVAEWKETGLVDHFPGSLPASARNVKFSAFPGFLQGGGHIQLRMELPAAEVKSLYDHATKTAKQHHDGGNALTLVNERDDGLYSTYPYTLAKKAFDFPSDYRIFVFDAKDFGKGQDWNHGESKGVVVSLQRNEALYYAESW